MIKRLDHLLYEERLRSLGPFVLRGNMSGVYKVAQKVVEKSRKD